MIRDLPALPASADTVLAEKPLPTKLDQAAKDFESLVVGELLKTMRSTVPQSEGGGFGRDVVNSMFDEQLSKVIAETGAFGIGNLVKGSMQADVAEQSPRPTAFADDGWVQPVDQMPDHYIAAQRFGATRPHDGGHQGLDIAEPIGAPVYAARAGTVVGVGRDPTTRGGLQVTIAHDNGAVRTRYMHLDSIDPSITAGTPVSAGTTIGAVGNTGAGSHGAHLHFEVEANGTHVDPQPFLPKWREKP